MDDLSPSKTVLVVDDEKLFLASLAEGLRDHANDFDLITAVNGKKALEELRKQKIDLVITDLKMPVMDGFQLLIHMAGEFPQVPIIVMTAFCTPEIENRVRDLDAFDLLEKPFDLQVLAGKIQEGLRHKPEGHVRGIMLFSFLQLIEIEQKTCTLRVRAGGKKGILHFSKGVLIDAAYGALNGEAAAMEIVCWKDAEIANSAQKIRKRIERPLQNLLMDAAKEKDEAALIGGPETDTLDLDEWRIPPFDSPTTDPIPMPLMPLDGRRPADTAPAGSTSARDEVSAVQTTNQKEHRTIMANNIEHSLNELLNIDDAMAAALVDSDSGMSLGTAGGGVNLEVAAAGNTEVVKAKHKVMTNLGLKDHIEDILISLGSQYHLTRPLNQHNNLFFYLVLNRQKSNLAMARVKLSEVEVGVQL